MKVRPATEADLEAIARIQAACPEASQWEPAEYLGYRCLVAEEGKLIQGFAVARETAPGESEVLNLAVVQSARRKGVARALLSDLIRPSSGSWFLEVRASNTAARKLYQGFGFQQVGERRDYYSEPLESAIVMRMFS